MRDATPEQSVRTFRARRRLKLGPDIHREPDELVPEAIIWPRYESQIHTGQIIETRCTPSEFEAALEGAVPPISTEDLMLIRERHLGLQHGPHRMPFTRTQVLKQVVDAAALEAQAAIGEAMDTPTVLTGPVPNAMTRPPVPVQRVKVERANKPVKRTPRKSPAKQVAPRLRRSSKAE